MTFDIRAKRDPKNSTRQQHAGRKDKNLPPITTKSVYRSPPTSQKYGATTPKVFKP